MDNLNNLGIGDSIRDTPLIPDELFNQLKKDATKEAVRLYEIKLTATEINIIEAGILALPISIKTSVIALIPETFRKDKKLMAKVLDDIDKGEEINQEKYNTILKKLSIAKGQ